MLRKTMVVLGIALVVGSSAPSTTAFARSGAGRSYIAGGSPGRGGFRGNHFTGGDYGGQHDIWGHWVAYYGPMVAPI
jgi:hypothetical protein